MAEALKAKRDALKQLASQTYGHDARSPIWLSGQSISASEKSAIMALPAVIVSSPQDLDPESETFMEFFYMAGYDPLGGAPLGG